MPIFLDLSKFYEKISHSKLLAEAMLTGYNLCLLRTQLGLYSGFRALVFNGCCSGVFQVPGTILAGCSGAPALARALLIRTFRGIMSCVPEAYLRNVVDDITLHMLGTLRYIARRFPIAFNKLFDGLRQSEVLVNFAKTFFVASSTEAARALAVARWG